MRLAFRIPKATDTHSEYLIIIAFPLQQWLQERASELRYTYIACMFFFKTTPTASAPSPPAPASYSVGTVVFPRGRGAGRGVRT
jgi:hypothetical protein